MDRFPTWPALAAALGLLTADPGPAAAEADAGAPAGDAGVPEGDQAACRVVEVEMVPSDNLQIVVWIEDEAGNYVDTAYISRLTGSYGLGNRPGMMEFNSAWRWPYGRRTTVFPIWAHRHGMEWPLLVFQNGDDTNLSHPLGQSSLDHFYCRPLREGETMWDTQTCASTVYTDKGMLSDTETSRYPPRTDLSMTDGVDDPSVSEFAGMNPFDGVSRATPPGGEPFRLAWAIPKDLPDGDYVAWVEVSREFDQNEHYDYPAPTGIPWSDYGLPYRGQPSVVYRVPFGISDQEMISSAEDYAGYGDPDGLDGEVREPDETITTDVPGSGAARLQLVADDDDMFRVRVRARPNFDEVAPGPPSQLQVEDLSHNSVTASFLAPGNDGDEGTVFGYEVRYLAGTPMDEQTFAAGRLASVSVSPLPPGHVQTLSLNELLPRTNYYIGVRAYDECLNYGPVEVLHVTTPERPSGSVDACFIATAAYGSPMAADVAALRSFRDTYLRNSVIGSLLVEAYYTFGPAFAAVIRESDTLRQTARDALDPIVGAVRRLVP